MNIDELIKQLSDDVYASEPEGTANPTREAPFLVMRKAAQALRDLHRAYRPPDMVDYNKAMARIEELEAALLLIQQNYTKRGLIKRVTTQALAEQDDD